MEDIKVGEEFKPAPQFKQLYYIYLMLGVLGLGLIAGVLIWWDPSIWTPFVVHLLFTLRGMVVLLAFLVFMVYWIPKYYDTVLYKLTENEIVWRRGVWFKNTGVVPYDRITNIDVSQGPVSRMLKIAALKIQTAGYSGQQYAEIKIEGIEQFEELRELTMGFVRGKKPVSVETYGGGDTGLKILGELVKIRELLEKSRKP